MSNVDPIDLFFGAMEKLGPGGKEHTLRVLEMLPKKQFKTIIDAGCGTGLQTITLASELQTPVHAIDIHQPFLDSLKERAKAAGVNQFIETHCIDIKDVSAVFSNIDLLWSEGAAYNIGFNNALEIWAHAITTGGIVVVSELAWLTSNIPEVVKVFFSVAYPEMQHTDQNIRVAENSGYKVLNTYTLPNSAWEENYYDILEEKALKFSSHPETAVREFADYTLEEIQIFRRSANSYGYVFYVLQRG